MMGQRCITIRGWIQAALGQHRAQLMGRRTTSHAVGMLQKCFGASAATSVHGSLHLTWDATDTKRISNTGKPREKNTAKHPKNNAEIKQHFSKQRAQGCRRSRARGRRALLVLCSPEQTQHRKSCTRRYGKRERRVSMELPWTRWPHSSVLSHHEARTAAALLPHPGKL